MTASTYCIAVVLAPYRGSLACWNSDKLLVIESVLGEMLVPYQGLTCVRMQILYFTWP